MQEKQPISSLEFKLLISLWGSFKFEAAHSGYYRTQNSFSLSFLSKDRFISSTFYSDSFWCILAYLHARVTKVSVNYMSHSFPHQEGCNLQLYPLSMHLMLRPCKVVFG